MWQTVKNTNAAWRGRGAGRKSSSSTTFGTTDGRGSPRAARRAAYGSLTAITAAARSRGSRTYSGTEPSRPR